MNLVEYSKSWPEPSIEAKIGFHSMQLILELFSVVSNIIIIISLRRVKKRKNAAVYYFLVSILAQCDLTKSIVRLLIFPWEVLESNMRDDWFIIYFNSFIRIFYGAASSLSFVCIFLAAFNRFLLFRYPRTNARIFGSWKRFRHCVYILLILFIINFIIITPDREYTYIPKLYTMVIKYTDPWPKSFAIAQLINLTISCPVLVAPILYCWLYVHLRRKLNHLRKSSTNPAQRSEFGREILLIVQGFTYWLLLVLWAIFAYFVTGNTERIEYFGYYWPFILLELLDISLNCCHPYIYLLCDRSLRRTTFSFVFQKDHPVSDVYGAGILPSVILVRARDKTKDIT